MNAIMFSSGNDEPKTLAEATYRRFRQDILWGKLAPDTPLRSDELRQIYGIGISPLREALSRLVSEHLVTSVGQRGFRVAPLTTEDVLDTMETRLVLEAEALRRSIQDGDVSWETAVVSTYHTLSRMETPSGPGEDAEAWAALHREFHMALLAGCKSRWMLSLVGKLTDQAERHRLVAMTNAVTAGTRQTPSEHKQIMEAALSRNTKAAVAALDHHLRTTADLVCRDLVQRRTLAAARSVES